MNDSANRMRTFFEVFGQRYGVDVNTIYIQGQKYMTRYILYISGYSLRLHKFWRGDEERALHDHPFWFITFPFYSYLELTESGYKLVKSWRFHYRPAEYRHRIVNDYFPKPFWTFVLAGRHVVPWGFWLNDIEWIYWRDWK